MEINQFNCNSLNVDTIYNYMQARQELSKLRNNIAKEVLKAFTSKDYKNIGNRLNLVEKMLADKYGVNRVLEGTEHERTFNKVQFYRGSDGVEMYLLIGRDIIMEILQKHNVIDENLQNDLLDYYRSTSLYLTMMDDITPQLIIEKLQQSYLTGNVEQAPTKNQIQKAIDAYNQLYEAFNAFNTQSDNIPSVFTR